MPEDGRSVRRMITPRGAVVAVMMLAVASLPAHASAAVHERVTNGGFEDGSGPVTATGWNYTASGGQGGSRCPAGAGGCEVDANHGSYFGVVGPFAGAHVPPNTTNYAVGTLSQVVSIPEWPISVTFSYRRTDFNAVNETSLTVTLGGNVIASITDAPAGVFNTVTVDLPPEATADAATLAFSGSCNNVTASYIDCDRYDIDDVSVQTGSDTEPPKTTITKAPESVRLAKGARTAPVKISFRSNEPGSTFQCKQDGGSWKACTSPHQFRLAKGTHTLRVRATDPASNTDPTPAKVTVRVLPHR